MADELILHHYPLSPFAEKARLMLGYKGLSWRSVHIPIVMPKPDLLALTGAYRRTPVLQQGADIWCDTDAITHRLEQLVPQPTLLPPGQPLAEPLAQWADFDLFWPAVVVATQPAAAVVLFRDVPPDQLASFGADRAAMAGAMRRPTLADATAQLHNALGQLQAQLERGGPWLLGEVPGVADFAVAHCLWFVRKGPPGAAILSAYPAVGAWLDNVLAFGHGQHAPMDSHDAVAVAADAAQAGRWLPCSVGAGLGFEAGQPVTVTPTDYAQDATAGTLVGLSRHEVVIRRSDPRAGTVQVHFPRAGFQIRKEK